MGGMSPVSAPNPLLAPSTLPFGMPDYSALTDEHYREAIEAGMAEHLEELRAVAEETGPATVENVLAAWERTGATLTRVMNAFWVAKAADTNDARDAIEEEFAPRLAAHSDAILLDRRLYDRLRALAARAEAGEVTLDEEDAYLLHRQLRDYERGGIALGEAEQERLRALNTEIATLAAKFDQLLVAGRNAAGVQVTDEAELEGLDAETRERLRASAERAGVEGWLIDVTNTTGQPILSSLHHRPLRERSDRTAETSRSCIGFAAGGSGSCRASDRPGQSSPSALQCPLLPPR